MLLNLKKKSPSTPIDTLGKPADTYLPNTIGSFVSTDKREMPWNTLGARVNNGTNHAELMTATEVLEACGLNFEVGKEQLHLSDGTPVPDRFATYRTNADGTRTPYGIVTGRYGAISPGDSLRAFDSIVESVDGAHYSSGWDMRERRAMGVTIELPEAIVLDPKGAADTVGMYLLGVNSFDGSTSLQAAVTGQRFYCFNQVMPTLRSSPRRYCMKHGVRNMDSIRLDAQGALGIVNRYMADLDKELTAMFQTVITDAKFDRLVRDIFPIDKDAKELVRTRVQARRDTVHALYAESPTLANIRGTKWGAYNAITEYADWGRVVRGADEAEVNRNRAVGTLVGRADPILNRAWARLG